MLKRLIALGCLLSGSVAHATTIDFEQFGYGTSITNQYQGVTFSGAMEATSAGIASYFVYAPHSGGGFLANLASTDLSMAFAVNQTAVSGYYTALSAVTLSAYDGNGGLLSTQTLAANNAGNTAWSVTGLGISRVDFTAAQSSFGLDDVTYSTPAVAPEPAPLMLMGTGLFAAAGLCIYKASRAKQMQTAA